jgi:hypothetical protein
VEEVATEDAMISKYTITAIATLHVTTSEVNSGQTVLGESTASNYRRPSKHISVLLSLYL